MNIYVGNLPYKISDADLRELFAAYGEVSSVSMVKDKMTGQSKGFGFVEMPEAGEAAAAIQGLNEKAVQGRNIKVNEAKPREDKPRGDRGGFRPREGGNGGAGFRPRNEGGFGGGRDDRGGDRGGFRNDRGGDRGGRDDRGGDRGGFRKREF
ncbi:MAG: RNA recognition motif domain-containing protein [Thiotrichaceae bacterium]|uniref:RNA-binding protein n=1 Tax=Candidatus Thiocaldithrix dubininis TaxID=3080823 RepID=A0AA95H4G2_9GAMM|nr:MAG: RNA-binding protein [Candidatus Thiocaldithrix dubininis]